MNKISVVIERLSSSLILQYVKKGNLLVILITLAKYVVLLKWWSLGFNQAKNLMWQVYSSKYFRTKWI